MIYERRPNDGIQLQAEQERLLAQLVEAHRLRRFDQFRESLVVARNVLTDRLNRLVEEGILERVRYNDRPVRYEYRLTRKGRDLIVAVTALRQWGDQYLSEKPPRLIRRRADKKLVIAALVPKGTEVLRLDDVEIVPGPGRTS